MKSSPFPCFFSEFYFCYAVVSGRFWGKGSASRSGDVLGWFWVCVSIWILYQIQGVLSAVFGFRCFFALSLPPSSSPPLFLVAGLGFPPPPSLRLLAGRRTPATWSGGSVMRMSSRFFSPLSARVGRRFLPPFSSPSALSLALSLLSCKHAQ